MAAAALVLAAAAVGSGSDSDPVRLGLDGAVNNGVSVSAAGSEVVVAWAARSATATDVYAAWSCDGGATFGAPARVNDIPGEARVSGEQAPRVALGSGVEVLWVSRKGGASAVRSARARAGERTFAPATTVHADNLTGARGWASLAVEGDGVVHVAWLDGRDAQAERASAPAGHSGHTVMRQDLFQAVLRPDGTRLEARVATDVCFCCKTGVATAPGGAVYVAWRHIYPPNLRDIAVARSTDGGRTFAAPVRVSEDGWGIDGCPDDGPSIAVDAAGVVHVAWPTLVPGGPAGKGIFYSYSSDGGRTFASRVRLDDGPAAAAHPQLAIAGDRVVVVWDQLDPEGRRIHARTISSDPTVAAWTPVRGLPSVLSGERPAVYPAVAATPTSTVVAWTEETPKGSVVRVRRLGR
jgi:hypothetical protein